MSGGQQGRQLAFVTDLIGKEINNGTQIIGSVDDVIVQIPSGTAAALLDPDDEFTGTDQKFIVPFNRLTRAGEDRLETTLSRQDFASSRVSLDESWANNNPDGYTSTLYLWPIYVGTAQTSTGSGSGGEMAQSGAGRQSGSQQQQPPVEQIRQALQNDSRLSGAQQSVQVRASGDSVVLSGTVQSEDIKNRIEDRAEQAAQGWNIDNQIRVAGADE